MGSPRSEFRGASKTFTISIPKILAFEAHFDVFVELTGPPVGTLPVLGSRGTGALVTDISGSGWLLQLHPRVVSPRRAGGTGCDAVPLSEGAEGYLSVPQFPHRSQHYGPVP